MRVAVVLPELDPESGGGFTFQSTLYEGLRAADGRSRHEFVFYTRADVGPGTVRMPSGRGPLVSRRLVRLVRDVQDRGFGIRPVAGRTWLERSLAEHAIDLVWFATPDAEECHLPYIFTVWDLAYLEQPWFPELRAGGEWELRHAHHTRYLPKATRVIVPNAAGREELLRHFPLREERVLTLPHPTPDFALAAAQRERPPRTAVERHGLDGRFLLYPAQYWPHKNHATLLEALKLLGEDGGTPYRLACVGSDKGALDHVKAMARELDVSDRVRFLGFVETDDLVALYRHAHALVYLSFFGPENLPPLEACALGCPVVQADVNGARDQLGDAALFVKATDAAGAAAAVRRLEDDGLRSSLVEAARALAASRTAERYVDGVSGFLDEFEVVRRCWA